MHEHRGRRCSRLLFPHDHEAVTQDLCVKYTFAIPLALAFGSKACHVAKKRYRLLQERLIRYPYLLRLPE
eukprot:938327-Amphidinium_carterae.1